MCLFVCVQLCRALVPVTFKPVLSGHSEIDKTQILMTNGSLMKVESIAECFLQYFLPALSDNRSKNQLWSPFE